MKLLSHLILCALAVLPFGLVAGVFVFWGDPDLADAYRSLAQEDGRAQMLKKHSALLNSQLESKERVAQAVIDQRMTMAEAIDVFRNLQAEMQEERAKGLIPPKTLTTDEEFRQAVLSWIRPRLKADPSRAAALDARLKDPLR